MLNALAASLANSQSAIAVNLPPASEPALPAVAINEPRCPICESQDLWKPIGSQDQSWRCMTCEKPPSLSFIRERFKPVKLDNNGQPIQANNVSGSNVDLSPWIIAMGEPACPKCKSAWVEINPIRESPYRCANCREEISSSLAEKIFFSDQKEKFGSPKISRQKFFTR